jgi:cytochrome c5
MIAMTRRLTLFAAGALVASTHAQAAEPQGGDKAPYRVVDGKVDESTFLGWRAFHSACHTCHGVDATDGPRLQVTSPVTYAASERRP